MKAFLDQGAYSLKRLDPLSRGLNIIVLYLKRIALATLLLFDGLGLYRRSILQSVAAFFRRVFCLLVGVALDGD